MDEKKTKNKINKQTKKQKDNKKKKTLPGCFQQNTVQ